MVTGSKSGIWSQMFEVVHARYVCGVFTIKRGGRRNGADWDEPMPIRQYDCIVVDRGYTLDRGMTEGEMELRDFNDYVSAYRGVLDYFDAVRIGLTATPAAHTVEIFGHPTFTYS
jgi:type I site-specific restriction endonuclease